MKIWRMSVTCWMPKATKTQSEHVMLIALLLKQWLHERTSLLLYSTLLLFFTLLLKILGGER